MPRPWFGCCLSRIRCIDLDQLLHITNNLMEQANRNAMRAVRKISTSCCTRITAVTACWLSTRSTSENELTQELLHQALYWKSNIPQSVAEGEHLALGCAARICRLSGRSPREKEHISRIRVNQLHMQPIHAAGCANTAVSIGVCGEL